MDTRKENRKDGKGYDKNNNGKRPFNKKFKKPFVVEVELPETENGLDEQLLPVSKTYGSCGYDLHCCEDEVTIEPGKMAIVDTGIKIKLPPLTVGWITPRSGLASKNGITVLNTPGEIDSDYRGPVKVLLINFGTEPFMIKKYDRIAQITFMSVKKGKMLPVKVLSPDEKNERGEDGFGSTGVK